MHHLQIFSSLYFPSSPPDRSLFPPKQVCGSILLFSHWYCCSLWTIFAFLGFLGNLVYQTVLLFLRPVINPKFLHICIYNEITVIFKYIIYCILSWILLYSNGALTPSTSSSSKISSVVSSKDNAESIRYKSFSYKYTHTFISKERTEIEYIKTEPPWIASWSLSTNSFLLPVVGSPRCFNSTLRSAT